MDALTLAPFILLLAAVLGLWLHRAVWLTALVVAVALGYHTGALQGLAALWIAITAALALFYSHARSRVGKPYGRPLQLIAGISFFLFALAMALALLPGFIRVELVPKQALSEGAEAYAIAVGFPKVVTGILILGLINPLMSRYALNKVLANAAPVFLLTAAAAILFVLVLGYTRFDPKWTPLFVLWAPINLFFTCLAEEAFFRGFVQHELASAGSRSRRAAILALVTAAILFGVAHFGGGATYVIAGVIAGLGYGWAFLRTQRIEAAMAVHFGVNAVHFLLFTYPRLA